MNPPKTGGNPVESEAVPIKNPDGGESAPTHAADATALLGFARRLRPEARPTSDWMKELREGEV